MLLIIFWGSLKSFVIFLHFVVNVRATLYDGNHGFCPVKVKFKSVESLNNKSDYQEILRIQDVDQKRPIVLLTSLIK